MAKNDQLDRVHVLDPLRGVASLAVCWFHLAFASSYLPAGSWLDSSGAYGKYGVQIFFVISGFILPYALHGRQYSLRDYPIFVGKRIVRLDPPYLATILGVVVLTYVSTFIPGWGGQFDVTVSRLAGHLAYVNAFIGEPWLVPVFWTLAIEFQFYLLVALIFPLLTHGNASLRVATLAIVCLLAWVFPHTGPTSFRPYVFQHIFLFAMGIATFWKYKGLVRWPSFALIIAITATGCIVTLGIHETAAGVLAVLAISFLPAAKGGRILGYLGTVSYSLYLVHLPIGDRILGLLERVPAVPKSAGLLLAVAASIVAAHVLWRLIEKPSQTLAGRIRYTRKNTIRAAVTESNTPAIT